ncbi:hypothetical protein CDD83_2682 [Cordyceps sp. RAO-2017]|nr:hypothetical protein CDD83_2682 [Cordyceps sp. RAO-2017]
MDAQAMGRASALENPVRREHLTWPSLGPTRRPIPSAHCIQPLIESPSPVAVLSSRRASRKLTHFCSSTSSFPLPRDAFTTDATPRVLERKRAGGSGEERKKPRLLPRTQPTETADAGTPDAATSSIS